MVASKLDQMAGQAVTLFREAVDASAMNAIQDLQAQCVTDLNKSGEHRSLANRRSDDSFTEDRAGALAKTPSEYLGRNTMREQASLDVDKYWRLAERDGLRAHWCNTEASNMRTTRLEMLAQLKEVVHDLANDYIPSADNDNDLEIPAQRFPGMRFG
jgi:hypothetical protein